MKRLIAFLTIGLLILFVAGCGSTDDTTTDTDTEMASIKEEIVGTWESELALTDLIESEETTTDGTAEAEVAEADETFTSVFEFKDDGTYTLTTTLTDSEDKSVIEGKYRIDGDELTLTTDTINGKNEAEYMDTDANSDATDPITADEAAFEEVTYVATIDGDELTLEYEYGTFTYTRAQ